MNLDDMILTSVDDHVVEPSDRFERHTPSKYRDRVPRVTTDADGHEKRDRHYTNQRWLGHDFGDKLPSDIFREHSLSRYVTDPVALKLRHEIGLDTIAWECDYPHSDSIWPVAPEFALAELEAAGATDEEIHKITWASRHFDFDPFEHTAREDATVNALRALSPDVDTTTRSRAERPTRYGGVATAGHAVG